MKLFKNIISASAGLLILFSSCDSLLDVDPSDQYSVDTFWKNEEHAQAGLTSCYNALFPYGRALFMETDMITPNAIAYNEANGTDNIARGVHTTTTYLVSYLWQSAFTGIGRANTFMDKVEPVPMKDELKNRMKGEARFLRAFYYHSLVCRFGGVPLILETPNAAAHQDLPRNTKEEVVDQILIDLTEAVKVLPDSYSGSDLGRVTKGAALTLKARVLLYEGRWSEAAAIAKEVIDMKEYVLFNDYRHFFSASNKHNSEVVFNVEFKSPEYLTGFDHNSYTLNRPAPTKDLIDSYLMTDGKSISESPLYDPAKPYENRDPRLLSSIRCVGYMYNGKITQPGDVVTTGFGNKKYTTYEDDTTLPVIVDGKSDFNSILMRYAEVLLTYAEAQNEAVGPDQSVYDAINEVRMRPSVDMPNVQTGLSKDKMREMIRLERRIELTMEGLYYSDILRWKTAEKVNNADVKNSDGITVSKRSFNAERDYLWPVPNNQIVLNPNLTQNPNWK